MTELAFVIPDTLWLSANDRMHWAPKSKRTKALRELAYARATDEPVGAFDIAHIAAFIGYPRNGRADPANAAPTVKALIDGLVDAGVFPDDDSTHVIGPTYLRGDKCPAGQHAVRLVLTEQEIPW
jgi:crossover junction endodeoxyribonuclease RusA